MEVAHPLSLLIDEKELSLKNKKRAKRQPKVRTGSTQRVPHSMCNTLVPNHPLWE